MKIIHVILKIVFTLILAMPILGALGVFPAPTRDLYETDIAFQFIQVIMDTKFVNYLMGIVQAIAIIALWTKREALAALLLVPITVNVIAFHAFLNGGLFTASASLALVLLALNGYFAWKNREQYKSLLRI